MYSSRYDFLWSNTKIIEYTIFSASIERWEILSKYLHGLTLKPIYETRWEFRLESVKAVKE